ncbi:hypothetical protein B0H12DRAFT_1157011 [Mycena haematopus]|nr:hypothetical protein B0H12DRAFT_1157011 [Mycena haematopus]
MPLNIPISELQQAAKKEVHDARRNGTLSDLNVRIIRGIIERKFHLEQGTLNAKEFKGLRAELKSAITEAAVEDLPSAEIEISNAKTKKRKSEEMPEPKSTKKQKTKSGKVTKNSKKYKSSETIPTSDIEDTEVNDTADTSIELEKPPAGPSGEAARTSLPATEHRVPPASKSKENQAISSKGPKPIASKASSSVAQPKARPSAASTPETPDSESELSVLDDDPPKKRKSQTAKPKDKSGHKSKSSKGKKATGSLSKDEETIKRLKSLVLACGVRRQWAKVFKEVDSPSQQIRMLKEILTGLGMSGRMSLEQAKAIKEKRELAQELEDVQTFAAAATRSKASKASEEKDEEESEEEELPAKRKTNARKSIMAFLGDQSDDD